MTYAAQAFGPGVEDALGNRDGRSLGGHARFGVSCPAREQRFDRVHGAGGRRLELLLAANEIDQAMNERAGPVFTAHADPEDRPA